MNTVDEYAKLYELVRDDRDQTERRLNEMQLALIAELDEPHTFMGTPVRLTVSWPDGPPRGFDNADAVRQWARDELAKLRGEPS